MTGGAPSMDWEVGYVACVATMPSDGSRLALGFRLVKMRHLPRGVRVSAEAAQAGRTAG